MSSTEGFVQHTQNLEPQQGAPKFREALDSTKQLIGRGALIVSIATAPGAAFGIAEAVADPYPQAAAAADGGYPDAAKPCVTGSQTDPNSSFNKVTGTGYWCSGYSWGDIFRNAQGQVTGFNENSSRGYGYRNCTDWVAFREAQLTGVAIPHDLGDSQNWDNKAAAEGFSVDNTPEIGDVAVWEVPPGQSFGHVAVVESVNANGSVNISEYNKSQDGSYGARSNVTANHYIHFGDLTGSTAPPDADQDGAPDTQDQCPSVPGVPANNGCPANKPNIVLDVNGDGKDDLVHVWSGGVNTWISNGNGTYTFHNAYKPTAGYNMDAGFDWKVGDFNGDGKTDLAHLWGGGVNTWRSNGDGTYNVGNTYLPAPGYSMTGGFDWEVGDENNDGKDDLFQLWSGGVNTWKSNGDGTYTVSNPYLPVNYNMTSGAGWKVGDFTGDGKADLLHIWNGGANIWASRGDGTYIVTNPYRPAGYNMTGGMDWKTGDFNGDGKEDLLHIWSGGFNVWRSNGDGTFNVSGPFKPANYNMGGGIDFKMADVNGDGKTDVMHLWSGGANDWVSNGDGTFNVKNPFLPFPGYSMTSGFEYTTGDTNGDGKDDLLHLWSSGVNTWKSNGDGTYTVSNPYLPLPGYTMTSGTFEPAY